jgi:hypothetical protein
VGNKATGAGSENPDVVGAANPIAAVNPAPAGSVGCPTCGQPNPLPGARVSLAGSGQQVYATGTLNPQFCSLAAEKAFAQLTVGAHQGDQVEVQLLQQVLRNPENLWFGYYLGWVFANASEDVGIFNVLPRNDADVTRLAEILSPAEADKVVHVVAGKTVPTPPDSPCAASGLLSVQADRVLAFTLQEFAAAMPVDESSSTEKPSAAGRKADRAEFEDVVRKVFPRLTRGAGNRGFAPEHIACNYLAVEFAPVYRVVLQAQREGKVLVGVDARHVHSADRRIVAVRVTVRQQQTEILEGYQIMVDASELPGPFVVAGPRRIFD